MSKQILVVEGNDILEVVVERFRSKGLLAGRWLACAELMVVEETGQPRKIRAEVVTFDTASACSQYIQSLKGVENGNQPAGQS